MFELRHEDLTRLQGEGGRLWRNVPIEARVLPWPMPSGWRTFLSALEEMVISALGDAASTISPQPNSVLPRDFCNAPDAFQQLPNKNVPAQPTARWRPILDAGTLAPGPRADCAESLELGRRHVRVAHNLGLGDAGATCGSHVRVRSAPTCAATCAAQDSDAETLVAGPRGCCAESSESGGRHARAAHAAPRARVRANVRIPRAAQS